MHLNVVVQHCHLVDSRSIIGEGIEMPINAGRFKNQYFYSTFAYGWTFEDATLDYASSRTLNNVHLPPQSLTKYRSDLK